MFTNGTLRFSKMTWLVFLLMVFLDNALSDKEINELMTKNSTIPDGAFANLGSPTTTVTQPSTLKEVITSTGSGVKENGADQKDGEEGRLGKLVERPGKITLEGKTTQKMSTSSTGTSGAGVQEVTTQPSRSTSVAHELLRPGNNIPPHIEKPLTNEMVIVLKEALNICCVATGQPKPILTWYKNGIAIKGDHPRFNVTGCLQSSTFTAVDNGWYHCRATNKHGTSVSQMKNIVAEVLPTRPDAVRPGDSYMKTVGEGFRLPCDVPYSLPRSPRRWYTDGVKEESVQLKMDERVSTDSNGTLHIAHIVPADSKTYKCGLLVESEGSIKMYHRGTLDVNIKGGVEAANRQPSPQDVTYYVRAYMYETAVLECYFSGKPIPEMTWKNQSNHDITPNSKYSFKDNKKRLEIKNIQQSDNGTYTCTAFNSKGAVDKALHLIVIAPPMIVEDKNLVPKTVPDKHDFTLYCKTWTAKDLTLSKPIWWRNGELLTDANRPDPARYSFSDDHTELTITDLDNEVDTAGYQCNTTNSVGYLFMDGYLRVIESIQITQKPPSEIVIDPEDPEVIDFTVLYTGDACCEINQYWTHNETQLTLDSDIFVKDEDSNKLYLNMTGLDMKAIYSTMGHYVCRVSNKHQAVEVKFELSHKYKNLPVIKEAEGPQLWWLGIIFGVLAIIVTIIIVIIILRSNYPRSTYMLEKTELKHNLNPEEDLLNQSFQDI